MAAILDEYPNIRQTFNLVPSLIEQVVDYTENGVTDAFLDVSSRRASELSEDERIFILENFFLANWDTMIKPYPRYYELLSKRGFTFSRADLRRTIRYFTDGDFLDLQVLFNLIWIDPVFRDGDPFIAGLAGKGKGYSEEEKNILIEKQLSIMRGIIPKYRELSLKGRIELSASPFYHPILPLLWDTNSARISEPGITLPQKRFFHPEDAVSQTRMALDYFERIFGRRPSGMWPSEGSVSEDVARAIAAEGIRWIASDEDVLARSIGEGLRDNSGNIMRPSQFYSAYEFSGLQMLFRDHKMSDLIGFVYSGWEPGRAAEDLINKFLRVYEALPHNEPQIVPIILDGENAWEYYRNDGRDFLRYLYEGISKDERLETVTISGYLDEHHQRRPLSRLHAGSWISANFNVWIGHEEDNNAWDYLTTAREDLDTFMRANPGRNLDGAMKALYIAEGSDWNWWYGDEHSTESAVEFDELFRLNLMKVYKEIGTETPSQLHVPILRRDRAVAPSMKIRGFINPVIDGIMTSYFEWYQGGYIDVVKSGGSMHMAESLISRIYYGFNKEKLFLRVDPKKSFDEFPGGSTLSIEIIRPSPFRIDIPLSHGGRAVLLGGNNGEKKVIKEIDEFAVADILECAVAFADIKALENDELDVSLSVRKGEEEIERCPLRGYIGLTVPTPDFEAMMWH